MNEKFEWKDRDIQTVQHGAIPQGRKQRAQVPQPRPKDVLAVARERSDTLPLFHTTTRAANEARWEWARQSPQESLELASKAGARLVYVRTVGEDADHDGEPALVELSFLCEGMFHCFRTIAPWADEAAVLAADGEVDEREVDADLDDDLDEDDGDEVDDAQVAAALTADEEIVVKQFMEHLRKSDEPIATNNYFIKTALEEFLGESRDAPEDAWNLPKYGRVVERIAKRVAKEVTEQEKSLLDGLVTECIAWARSNGLQSLNQSDAQVFLDEKNIKLSHESMRAMWQKVKFELKANRSRS